MTAQTVIIKDETFGEKVINEFIISFLQPSVTVADIIIERVRYEAENYNKRVHEDRFLGLVQPTNSEAELNGYRLKKGHQVDVKKQIDVALEAFEQNNFFMLIDDVQAEKLDERVTLHNETCVVFLKVTPLVGG